ncbi:hypothetical protein [Methylopila turkensis]|uniref:Uncharacterized protein n=1 Tax=Methylopila turkensis TaxID=1437816 RepID=A0A9W6JN35_9HYPH|nr:hypothetical protein [Methylopila turkensis]GLK78739.1 hypothetical protein GCM10008174_04800 [Methylopila turkensis]
MNSAPITAWEGAKAYFTFADRPGVLMFFCAVAIVACAASIASMMRHETSCSKKLG